MKKSYDIYTFIPEEDRGKFSDTLPQWPDFEPLMLSDNYKLRLLKEDKVDFLNYAKMWKKSYPALYRGVANYILYPKNYLSLFGKGEDFMKHYFFAFVFEDVRNSKIFGGCLLCLDRNNHSANAVLLGIIPSYRNKVTTARFLYKFVDIYDKFVEKSGVEYGWAGAITHHKISQKLLSHVGYKVKGIIPGISISSINNFYYRRDNYVYMDKFYNNGDKKYPEEMDLIPEARKIWDFMCTL